jgi:TatD DNase family protein
MNGEPAARGFDFHCHIDLYPDPVAMIAACEENRIVTLAVTTTPKAWPQNRKWVAHCVYTYAAVGLHPEVVGERHRELALLEEYMKESRLVGEIGLDGSPQYRKSWDGQTMVFTRALAAAQRLGGRVVSIHSRRAANEVVRRLEEHTTPERVLPILHWFSGSVAAARKAASLGCYFSINHRTLERCRNRAGAIAAGRSAAHRDRRPVYILGRP